MVNNMLVYLLIFISKIIENAVSTLRLIVVSNGKKKLGALLQGIVALVWIFVTGIVIIDVNKDPIKIIIFCIGSIVGSYLGSVLEEKIAMGTNMLVCVVKEVHEMSIKEKLNNYQIITLCEKDKNYSILFIVMKRKETNKISNLIKDIDDNAIIISEKIKTINNMV
jgi:uncharacterized protein YebE (UPF0316 family)